MLNAYIQQYNANTLSDYYQSACLLYKLDGRQESVDSDDDPPLQGQLQPGQVQLGADHEADHEAYMRRVSSAMAVAVP